MRRTLLCMAIVPVIGFSGCLYGLDHHRNSSWRFCQEVQRMIEYQERQQQEKREQTPPETLIVTH